jgi:hypothetical protein
MRKAFALLVVLGLFAFASAALAQSQTNSQAAPNPLVQLLESKGILTPAEAATVSKASSPAEANQTLAKLLLSKGLITQQEYAKTVQAYAPTPAASVTPTAAAPASAQVVPAVLRGTAGSTPGNADESVSDRIADILPGGTSNNGIDFGTVQPNPAVPEPAAGPKVIPAYGPIRTLPVGFVSAESVKPLISLGPIHVQPYGFIEMKLMHDTSNYLGFDAPLQLFLADSGPDANPEFHLNARTTRIGAVFGWIDHNPKVSVTGKIEFDFEGNFTRVFNRNISTVRSSQPSLRLAYGRIDYKVNDRFGYFGLFGQDWTPFCSSTLDDSVETTLFGVGYGMCYERLMQLRTGFHYDFGSSRHVTLQPEFAIAYPALGANPSDVASQLEIGERQGADADKPEFQSRIVLQFQLDKAPEVPPAQLIVSGMIGRGRSIVRAADVPTAFRTDFGTGAATSFRTFGVSAEAQLPTRWFTLQAKWWSGEALRFYFIDNLDNTYNDTQGLLGVTSASSVSGSGAVVGVSFGCTVALVEGVCPAGDSVIAPQRPFRGVGGLVDLGIPLSRIFNANPAGRNAGWRLNLLYNVDQTKARDLRHAYTTGGGRYKNDWAAATLYYKLNSWVTFGYEQGYYRSRALAADCAPECESATPGGVSNPLGLPLFRGLPARSEHDLHSQFVAIFAF